jgi:hypothetical protein
MDYTAMADSVGIVRDVSFRLAGRIKRTNGGESFYGFGCGFGKDMQFVNL